MEVQQFLLLLQQIMVALLLRATQSLRHLVALPVLCQLVPPVVKSQVLQMESLIHLLL
jgi:hypothetical protein